MKNKNFPGSVFITGIVFLLSFIYVKDDKLFALVFVFTQLFAGMGSVILIFLRFFRFINNRGSFMYCLTTTFQLALFITDIGLLFDQHLIKRAILIFIGMNAVWLGWAMGWSRLGSNLLQSRHSGTYSNEQNLD